MGAQPSEGERPRSPIKVKYFSPATDTGTRAGSSPDRRAESGDAQSTYNRPAAKYAVDDDWDDSG